MDPDRRDHDETYRGHQLSVVAQREGARWTWWYVIDGEHSWALRHAREANRPRGGDAARDPSGADAGG